MTIYPEQQNRESGEADVTTEQRQCAEAVAGDGNSSGHALWLAPGGAACARADPADEMVLEAAVNGCADVLVTFNLRDYGAIPLQFGIEVLRPRDALRRIAP